MFLIAVPDGDLRRFSVACLERCRRGDRSGSAAAYQFEQFHVHVRLPELSRFDRRIALRKRQRASE